MNARSVDYLPEEKKVEKSNGNAPAAEADTPSPETKPAFDVSEIKNKIPKPFQSYIDPILSWANSVEARINEMQKTMPETIQKSMENAIENQRKRQMEMYQKNVAAVGGGGGQPQGMGGLGMGSLAPLLQMFMGAGQDDEMTQLSKQMMQMNLLRMKQDMSFTDAIKNAIVGKIAGKAAEKVAEGV